MRALLTLIAALILAGACSGSGGGPTPTPRPTLPPYSGIKFCVDAIGFDDDFEGFAIALVEGIAGRQAKPGCPSPWLAQDAELLDDLPAGLFMNTPPEGWGHEPGLFVYIFADGHAPYPEYRFTTEERFCIGDVCQAASDGLYLEASELCDGELFSNAILYAVGQRNTIPVFNPSPTPYFDAPLGLGVTPSPNPTPTPVPTPCY